MHCCPAFQTKKCREDSHRPSRSLTPWPSILNFSPSAMDKSCPIPEPFRAKAGTVFFLAGLFLLNFVARFILAPLMPFVEQDIHITHAQAGSLFLVTSAGFAVTLFASGFVSSRLTHRKALILSAITVGIALLALGFMRSLAGIRLVLIVLGLAAGFHIPSALATITAMVRRQDWGKAMGRPFLCAHPWTCSRSLDGRRTHGVRFLEGAPYPLGCFDPYCRDGVSGFWKVWGFPGRRPKACSAEADSSAPLLLDHHPFAHDGGRGERGPLYRDASLSRHGTRHGQYLGKLLSRVCSGLGVSCCFSRRVVCGQGRPKAGHGCPSCGGRSR